MSGQKVIIGLALMLVALGVTGCRGVERPSVELIEGAVAERTREGVRVEVALRLSNPNDVVLPVTMVRYRMTVEGAGTLQVVDDPAVALPPGETQTVTLAAAYRDGQYAFSGRRFEVQGTFSYQPPGQLRELLSQYRIPLPVVPFTMRGELSAPDERMSRHR